MCFLNVSGRRTWNPKYQFTIPAKTRRSRVSTPEGRGEEGFLLPVKPCVSCSRGLCGLIVRVRVVPRRTVVGDIDRRFDNLSGSHHQSKPDRKLTIRNSHDSDDDFRSGCRNVGQCHQQQSFSGLLSPGRSNHTND